MNSGVDRIGVAAQRFDPRHRQFFRPQFERRCRRGTLQWRRQGRGVRRRARSQPVLSTRAQIPENRHAGERFHALQETRGRRWRAAAFFRAAQHDFRRAETLRKIMGGLADAPLRRGQAELGAHRAVEEAIGLAARRPDGFVQPRHDEAVDADQARFEQPENFETRMRARRSAQDLFTDQGVKKRGIAFGVKGESRISRTLEFGEQVFKRLAICARRAARPRRPRRSGRAPGDGRRASVSVPPRLAIGPGRAMARRRRRAGPLPRAGRPSPLRKSPSGADARAGPAPLPEQGRCDPAKTRRWSPDRNTPSSNRRARRSASSPSPSEKSGCDSSAAQSAPAPVSASRISRAITPRA